MITIFGTIINAYIFLSIIGMVSMLEYIDASLTKKEIKDLDKTKFSIRDSIEAFLLMGFFVVILGFKNIQWLTWDIETRKKYIKRLKKL